MSSDSRFGSGPVERRHGAHLPHWERERGTYAVTFRLFDALPASVVEGWLIEQHNIIRRAESMGRPLSPVERDRLDQLHAKRIDEYLDRGAGACFLNDPRIADLVANALRHFDGQRYDLIAWVVMPNHAHVVFQVRAGHELSAILHSWKSFTANEGNRLLRRSGMFWQAESYDHLVRGPEDLGNQIRYVLRNPVDAGLRDWRWVWCRESDR